MDILVSEFNMSYLSETYLRNFSQSDIGLQEKSRALKFNKSLADISVFLSHSHKDKDLVLGIIETITYLGNVTVYVDWDDLSMPQVTNRETAERIKKHIATFDYFLVLATKNAMESRWVPWEIGIADSIKSESRIAIIPVTNQYENFKGNEYLQLYRRIEITEDNRLGVFLPNKDSGPLLHSWLTTS